MGSYVTGCDNSLDSVYVVLGIINLERLTEHGKMCADYMQICISLIKDSGIHRSVLARGS